MVAASTMNLSPDDVVISGMSGYFPNSRNIDEFSHGIYNKQLLVTPNRIKSDIPDFPKLMGTLQDLNEFDAGNSGAHWRIANFAEPTLRFAYMATYKAILDAGMNPSELENQRVGFFTASCMMGESEVWLKTHPERQFPFYGLMRYTLGSRLSYIYKTKGPIISSDSACSSSMNAVYLAFNELNRNTCDIAFVIGCNSCLCEGSTLQFLRLGVLSTSGICRCFDEKANGYVRGEAVCVLVLQKAKMARRTYAQIVTVKSNCDGYKEQGITYPSGDDQRALFEETFKEIDLKPESLSYIEAHGTGTTVGDPEECAAIDRFFCKNRKTPLPVGSIKSNIGHTEPASGACSIVKVILSFETGYVPPNINFDTPNPKIKSIVEGRMKVITDTMKIKEEIPLVALNNFGFGGSNVHLLLKPCEPLKNKSDGIETPRLVFVSGRTKAAVDCLLDDIQRHLDVDQIRLYHSIFCKYLRTHLYRGYTIVSKTGELQRAVYTVKTLQVPTLLLSFGEYASWQADFHHFLSIPIFNDTIRKAERILVEQKSSLNEAISNSKGRHLILGSIIAQAALADVLKAQKTSVKATEGCSYGKLIRAYYNNDVTLEEVVKTALILNEHVYETAKQKIGQPVSSKDVEVSFNNDRNGLVKNLQKVLPNSLTNGFIDGLLKKNQEIDGKSLESRCVFFEIGESNLKEIVNNLENIQLYKFHDFSSFLECLGNLYFVGHTSSLDQLYPKIEFPVRRGTPMISSKIKLNKKKWWVFEETMMTGCKANKFFHIDPTKMAWQYVTGHVIDGRNLFPASGYLQLVWNSLTSWGLKFQSITFEDCRFMRATTLNNQGVSFKIQFSPSGKFEISEGGSLVVSGKMFINKDDNEVLTPMRPYERSEKVMSSKDIYKELRLRGYNYSGGFRGLREANIDGTASTVVFKQNWVTFLDNLFQLKILAQDSRMLYVPTFIEKITINCNELFKKIKTDTEEDQILEAFYYKDTDCIRTLGVEIKGLHASAIQRRKNQRIPVLESYDFVPNLNVDLDYNESIRVNTQIVLENTRLQSVKVVEVVDNETPKEPMVLSEMIVQSFQDQPLIQANATVLSSMNLDTTIKVEKKIIDDEKDCELIVASRLLQRPELLVKALNSLKSKGFIISREPLGFNPKLVTDDKITIITTHNTNKETLVLLNKTESKPAPVYIELADDEEFNWLPSLQNTIKESSNVVVYSENNPNNGILGFTNCLVREPGCGHVRCVALLDNNLKFDPDAELFAEQIRKNLTVNVYKNGRWGTYRHLLLDEDHKVDNEHYLAKIMVRGDLSTFKWVQGPLSRNTPLKADETLVQINYSSINFKDIMTATAKLNLDSIRTDRFQDTIEGFEFSGVDQNGRRVMGLSMGGLSNMVATDVHFTFSVPDDWSLKEAASVPSVYCTVVFALFMSGQMQKGDSILIHSGSGGVGQAAIFLCLKFGCEVFTTCGTQEKVEFLLKKFPGLKRSHVGNSRDTTFERMVMRETDGKGVDLVLNSLSEEKLMASVRCLAKGGRFLEIGKYDLGSNTPLNLLLLEKEASFKSICLDNYFYQTVVMKQKLKSLLESCIKQGLVKPLDVTVFEAHEIEQAFRFMTSGKHMGKVVIEIQPEGAPLKQVLSNPRWFCKPNKSYVILGGLGGFGLELADWLILRGATHVVLSSRSGPKDGYQMSRVKRWRQDYGIVVQISRADVSTRKGCEDLIKKAEALAPVGAIFNLAVVLRDAIFENQSQESFQTSFAPKARAATYLDEISRKSCPDLEHFVIFSSVSCGRGNAGQTNYGMANSVMERICEQRKRAGLPAVAIQWGAIGDVGLVADSREDDGTEIAIGGSLQQKLSSCLHVMDLLLTQDRSAVVSSVVVAEKRNTFGGENMSEAVANILGLDLKIVQNTQTLAELGMDSMTTVEIKQMLEREQGVFLSAKDIRTLTFGRLKELEEEKSNSDKQAQNDNDFVGKSINYLLEAATGDSPIQVQVQLHSNLAGDALAHAPEIIMIPGIEGVSTILEPLAKKLNARVTVFQFDLENPADNIPDMIQNEVKYIQANFDRSKPICIVAHSSGTMLAQEIVHRLEQNGYRFNLICCDGSTKFTKQLLPKSIEGDFETAFLFKTLDLFLTMEIKEAIMQKTTIGEKIDVASDLIAPILKITVAQLKKLLAAFMKRGKAFNEFDAKYSMKSNVTLLKASVKALASLSDDYDLGEYCGVVVKTVEIEGDHVSMLYNDQVAAIINSVALN